MYQFQKLSRAPALKELLAAGTLIPLEKNDLTINSDTLVIHLSHWNALHEKTTKLVENYHKDFPLRRGIPREELKSKLKLSPRIFNVFIAKLLEGQVITLLLQMPDMRSSSMDRNRPKSRH